MDIDNTKRDQTPRQIPRKFRAPGL